MSVQVVCRVRPPSKKEGDGREIRKTVVVEDNEVILWRAAPVRFSFDHALDGTHTQRDAFELVRPLVEDVVEGYEATVFAYGQTGTGKTHTMMGDLRVKNMRGIIPRAAEYLCKVSQSATLQQPMIWVSFLEIYNEDLTDLLSPGSRLQIQENGSQGTVCKNLSQHSVTTVDEVMAFLQSAQERQKVCETKMNKVSSRSHCIFTIKVQTEKKAATGEVVRRTGKLHLVDLAGSECGKSAGGGAVVERERKNINQSLLTLGRVVGALKSSDKQRIPYRDSKLTRLLKESLGGRCKTLLIATLSPSHQHAEETLSTLQYASNALGVVNAPVRNESFARSTSLLSEDIQKHMRETLFTSMDSNFIDEKLDKAIATLVERRCAELHNELHMKKQIDKMIEKSVVEHFRCLEEATPTPIIPPAPPSTPLTLLFRSLEDVNPPSATSSPGQTSTPSLDGTPIVGRAVYSDPSPCPSSDGASPRRGDVHMPLSTFSGNLPHITRLADELLDSSEQYNRQKHEEEHRETYDDDSPERHEDKENRGDWCAQLSVVFEHEDEMRCSQAVYRPPPRPSLNGTREYVQADVWQPESEAPRCEISLCDMESAPAVPAEPAGPALAEPAGPAAPSEPAAPVAPAQAVSPPPELWPPVSQIPRLKRCSSPVVLPTHPDGAKSALRRIPLLSINIDPSDNSTVENSDCDNKKNMRNIDAQRKDAKFAYKNSVKGRKTSAVA